MLEPPRPPPLVGGFIISPSIEIKAMVVITHVVMWSRDWGGNHGFGSTFGVTDAKRRAEERGGESSVLGLVVMSIMLVVEVMGF